MCGIHQIDSNCSLEHCEFLLIPRTSPTHTHTHSLSLSHTHTHAHVRFQVIFTEDRTPFFRLICRANLRSQISGCEFTANNQRQRKKEAHTEKMNKFVDDIIDKIGRTIIITLTSHKFGLAFCTQKCCYTNVLLELF